MHKFELPADLLPALGKAHGTPFWLYDAATIRGRLSALKVFDHVRFAQKANSNVHLLRLLKAEGAWVDAVSAGEIVRALKAGYDNRGGRDEIVFTADVLTREVIELVKAHRIPVNAGSVDMLQQLGQAAPGHRVWLRINPGFGHGHSQKTNTGGEHSKHGIWHGELAQALAVLKAGGLSLAGLHMHIGSGVDYGHLSQVCDAMVALADQVIDAGFDVPAISAGGGLSIPYREGDPAIDVAHYFGVWDAARSRIAARTGRPVLLELEPGRYLVAESGLLVAEVRAIKSMGRQRFVLVDAGFNDLMRPAMYGAHHAITAIDALGRPVTGDTQPVVVGGPLCESGDVFTQGEGGTVLPRELPAALKVGDLLVFHDAGAYGASMSSNYNSRGLLPEWLWDAGEAKLIRRRQTIDDLLALEL